MANGRNRGETLVEEIRIYIEGGGDYRSGKAAIREGFAKFLSSLNEMARQKRIRWNLIACGSRDDAFSGFQTALKQHPSACNILLVDAEGPVNQSPRNHLSQGDGWDVSGVSDDGCHLMVQTMETWIIADRDALKRFYGHDFNLNHIPLQDDVEQIDKIQLENALRAATCSTQKGPYHKIRHAPKILGTADPQVVQEKAGYCRRMFETLTSVIQQS